MTLGKIKLVDAISDLFHYVKFEATEEEYATNYTEFRKAVFDARVQVEQMDIAERESSERERAAQAAWEEQERYEGYTIADLRVVFNAITEGMDNWKKPFAVWALGESILPICAAIKYFTGDVPTVSLNTNTMRYLIETKGYYGACGA